MELPAIQLSQADDGRAVTVAAGQHVVVRLPENPTTGYRWEPATNVELAADEYFAPEEAAMGAGGERVFTLVASATTGEARFALTRAWGSGAAERTFTVRLTPGGRVSASD